MIQKMRENLTVSFSEREGGKEGKLGWDVKRPQGALGRIIIEDISDTKFYRSSNSAPIVH